MVCSYHGSYKLLTSATHKRTHNKTTTHNTQHTPHNPHTPKMAIFASAAAASSAASSAAINDVNSDDDVAPDDEVSSDLVVSSDDDDDDDDDDPHHTHLRDIFFHAARDIQNRTSRIVGTAEMEDRRFRELFGARMEIVLHLWKMMEEDNLLPEKSKPKHLLWTLYFMKVYPREGPGCSAVGGSGGAVDPKTLRKWVWLFIERIGELADDTVSGLLSCSFDLRLLTPSPPPPVRSSSKAG